VRWLSKSRARRGLRDWTVEPSFGIDTRAFHDESAKGARDEMERSSRGGLGWKATEGGVGDRTSVGEKRELYSGRGAAGSARDRGGTRYHERRIGWWTADCGLRTED